mmetsp:Transcript_2091/g.4893  ORF Transcript_2091/g.4893 Transcript_2091/m.4893 type:complete len:91 (+) Transcript_2091:79-351(+)|eukprot:CAMPEP_0177633820 /NCGR_PEP_ID=MMETSP0447-20121125/3043_1 /TAXON_ID=0 /ORGANISM="Stygamoeba regulata, Strain BSH-02190019" /LENGTH=90 /DNA_ID=CAMNT_0019135509 /DNA_START=68 /DNA_END=340 /DNA_ORIENTATION=-
MSQSYRLQHPGSCTGMFWRADPRPGAEQEQRGNAEWPRNGSILEGIEEQLGGETWLQVTRWKQANKEAWVEDCAGLWMPFHQGGLLLHKL